MEKLDQLFQLGLFALGLNLGDGLDGERPRVGEGGSQGAQREDLVGRRPEDLAQHNCLDYTFMETQGVWHLNGYNGDVSIPVSGTLRINDDEALSQAVPGGLGLALLPTFIVGKDLQASIAELARSQPGAAGAATLEQIYLRYCREEKPC